jgi:hypothetical protein
MARGTVARTRGRFVAEALPTMWSRGALQPRGLLARVGLWLRKKLSLEALTHGLPAMKVGTG